MGESGRCHALDNWGRRAERVAPSISRSRSLRNVLMQARVKLREAHSLGHVHDNSTSVSTAMVHKQSGERCRREMEEGE